MRLNFRFLSDLIVVSIILTGLTIYAHKYQVRRSGPLILKLAREARDAGKVGEAAQFYMRYLKLEPKSSEATGELGELAALSGNKEGTYYQLSKSLRIDPSKSELRGQLAEIAVQLERYADAKRILLGEVSGEFRNQPRRLWLLGVSEQELEEFDNAREHLAAAVAAAPDEPIYAETLADLLTNQFSDAEGSKQVLDRLVSEAADNVRVYLIRANWSLQRAEQVTDDTLAEPLLAAAWDDVQRALELEPKNPELAILAASIAVAQGTPEQAREIAEAAIAANLKRSELYQALVQIETESNNRNRAIEWLDQGLTEIPDDSDLLWKLAQLQYEADNTEKVEEIIAQLRSQSYPEGPIRLLEARMLVDQDQFREAADLLEKSNSLFQLNPDLTKKAVYLLANCYQVLGDSEQELAALRRVVAVDPQWIPAREDLARVLFEIGSLRESMSEYMLVVDRPDPSADAQIGYARLLLREGLGKPGSNWHWNRLQSVLATLDSIPEAAADAAIIRAELQAAQGQQQEAEDLLRSQIKEDANALLASQTLIELLSQKQDWEEVESVLQLTKNVSGDAPALRLQRARYLIERYGEQADDRGQLVDLTVPQAGWNESQRAELAAEFARLFLEIENYPACEQSARMVVDSQTYQPKLDFYLLLFDLAMRSGHTDAMNTALERIEQFEAADPLLRIGEGVRLMIEAGALPETNTARRDLLYEQALTELAEAADRRSSWSLIPRLKGNVYDRWGQPKLAVKEYLNAIMLGANDADLISRTSSLLFEQEQFREADEAIRKLQEQNTQLSYELTRIASQVALELDNLDRARDLAQECVDQSGKVEDHLLLAEICRLSEDLEAAQQEFRSAIEMDPANPGGWISLVQTLADQSDIDEARNVIEEARQALPAELLDDTLGQCFFAIKDYAQAEQHYLDALQATPSQPSQIRRVADFYLSTGRSSEAEPLLKKLIDEKPESGLETSDDDRSWARRKLALIYGLQDGIENFRRAKELIAANTQQDEPSREDQRVLGIIYGNRPDNASRKKAIALLEEVVGQQPSYSLDDNFVLAELFDRTGNWESYRRTMRSVLSQGGEENPICVRYHAAALLREGELEEAETWVRRLNSLAPGESTTNAVILEWMFVSQNYALVLSTLNSIAADQANWRWSAAFAEKFGTKLSRQGAKSQAEPFLLLASKLYAQAAEAAANPNERYLLTAFHARQGDLEKVFDRLSDPDVSADVLAEISQMALQSGQLSDDQAQRLLDLTSEALQGHAENELLGLTVADLHSWVGNWNEATEAYKALIQAQPDSVAVLNNMAMMFAMADQRLDVAMRAVQRAIAKAGAIDTLLDTRGMVYLADGEPQLAEQDFQASIETNESVDRLFHLAQALYAQGRIGEARLAFERAQEGGLSELSLHRQQRAAYEELASEL